MRESDARKEVSSERPRSIARSEGSPLLVKNQAIGVPFLLVRFHWARKENEHSVENENH